VDYEEAKEIFDAFVNTDGTRGGKHTATGTTREMVFHFDLNEHTDDDRSDARTAIRNAIDTWNGKKLTNTTYRIPCDSGDFRSGVLEFYKELLSQTNNKMKGGDTLCIHWPTSDSNSGLTGTQLIVVAQGSTFLPSTQSS
jgi:hypothetical protein